MVALLGGGSHDYLTYSISDVAECLGYGVVEGSDDELSISGLGLRCYLLCRIMLDRVG